MNKLKLDSLQLSGGSHHSQRDGACVMEMVSYVAGEPWSDHPQCACPVLSEFLRRWNDHLNDSDRQILKPLIPHLVNSKTSAVIEHKRTEMISDWYFRVYAPTWLDLANLNEFAKAGRKLGSKADWAAAGDAAGDAARVAAWAAAGVAAWAAAGDAAGAAAGAAAWAAAGDAARVAARAAAGVAAWAAAGDAAGAAAWAAARDAAGVAARAALRPTVIKLQKSALELVYACLDLQ